MYSFLGFYKSPFNDGHTCRYIVMYKLLSFQIILTFPLLISSAEKPQDPVSPVNSPMLNVAGAALVAEGESAIQRGIQVKSKR